MERDEFVDAEVDVADEDGNPQASEPVKQEATEKENAEEEETFYVEETEEEEKAEEDDFETVNLDEGESEENGQEQEEKTESGNKDVGNKSVEADKQFNQNQPETNGNDNVGGRIYDNGEASNGDENIRRGNGEVGNDSQLPSDEISSRIKPEFLPKSREFRQACKRDAEKRVKEEFQVDEYDEFDEEQKLAFMEAYSEAVQERGEIYKGAVQYIKSEKARAENEQKQISYLRSVDEEVGKICDTKELKQKLDEAIDGATVKFVQEMRKDLLNGKPEKFLNFARQVASKNTGNKANGTSAKPKIKAPLVASELFD